MKQSLFFVLALAIPCSAAASPRALPFTYPYQTPPAGSFEVEQYLDLTPVRVTRELSDGTTEGVWGNRSVLQTELEYAVTDHLELAFYFAFQQAASSTTPILHFQGIKQRARYRFGEAGQLPVDVAAYLEVAELQNEIEVEEKLILGRQFGRLMVGANLWVEQEYYFQTDETKLIYNPTIGASYELAPATAVGLEYWARGRFDSARTSMEEVTLGQTPIAPRTVHYLGPTFLYQTLRFFFSVGLYGRLDSLGERAQPSDPFGKLWVRTIVGIDL